jgi:phage gpG-like protein
MSTFDVKVLHHPDLTLLDKLVDTLKNLNSVRVGVPKGPEEKGTSLAVIAAVHEFGAPSVGIPERPFLRNTIKANQENYIRLNRINAVKAMRGQMNPRTALMQLGMMAQGDVQKFMANNSYTLKPLTIKRKGSSRALIDNGQLRLSITFEIEGDK